MNPHNRKDSLGCDRLLVKYKVLLKWRLDRERGLPLPHKDEFRALAEEFPGALRELDTMPMSVIEERANSLAKVCFDGADVEPWMQASIAYHQWMRVALWLKPRTTREHTALAQECSVRFGLSVDSDFVSKIAAPMNGRLRPTVLEKVCQETALSLDHVRVILLPSLRTDEPITAVES